jgi:hypothetical protein
MLLTGLLLSLISGELPKIGNFIQKHPAVLTDMLEQ